MSRVIVVGLSLLSICRSVILSSCPYARFLATNADGTNLDMKDEDHGLNALMACLYGVDGKRAYGWIDDTQDSSQTTTPNLI